MPAVPPIVPPTLGELARQAIARATTAAPAPVLVPRRFPPSVAGAVLVSLALGLYLWRQWQEAVDAPIQGPPVPQWSGANNSRSEPASGAPAGLFDGPVTGSVPQQAGEPVTYAIVWLINEYRAAAGPGNCGAPTVVDYSGTITDTDWGIPYAVRYEPINCGFSWVGLVQKRLYTPFDERYLSYYQASGGHPVDIASFSVNASVEPGTPAKAAASPWASSPAADPTRVPGTLAPGLAPAPPRSLGTPIGAPLPRVASGSSVGAGVTIADIGVPVSAIPTTPSIAPVGAATSALGLSQTAAQAAAIAAAAAALAGQGIGALTGAGGVALPVPGAIPQTGAETVFGGVAIGTIAQAVPATIAAVASEVGKIEQKLEIIARMPAIDVDPEDWLSIIKQIYDYLVGFFPAGGYELIGPCEPADSNGNLPDPLVATWAGGSGGFSKLDSKLDALAELIQHHKNLRQPMCGRIGGAQGGGVTVHFEQVD